MDPRTTRSEERTVGASPSGSLAADAGRRLALRALEAVLAVLDASNLLLMAPITGLSSRWLAVGCHARRARNRAGYGHRDGFTGKVWTQLG